MTAPIEPSPMGRNGILHRAGTLVAVLIPLLLGGCAAGVSHPAAASATQVGSPGPVASTAAPVVATSPSPTPTAGARPATAPTPGSALAVLAGLPVKGRAPMTGYARVADFGT